MVCMVTFTINISLMLAYIPYMDPMGYGLDTKRILVSGVEFLQCSNQLS